MTQTSLLNPNHLRQVGPTSSSVFVISGGAKGITAQCIIKLAQHQPCKFILLGRSELLEIEPDFARDCLTEAELKKRIMEQLVVQGEKPTPMSVQRIYHQITSSREIKKTLSAIQQSGAKAEYISVDVTDLATLQGKLRNAEQRLGTITGIIHGAGNLADKLIEKKTEQDFEKVYTAKVQGLENLLACVNLQQLQHLILFSSVTGFYGNIGQTDYAIANEILNKSAQLIKQYYPQCHVVAINWGGWDSGMVTPELKKAFAERGIEIIPVEVGTQMLVNELHPAYHDTTQVVIGDSITPPPTPLDSELRSYRIRRRMTVADNPFLQDHTIAGSPVLPATCAMSWMINICERMYPGYRYFSCKDFKVLKGIVFDENLADEYVTDVQEISKSDTDGIELQTKVWRKNAKGLTQYNFSASVKLMRVIPGMPTYESMDLTEDNLVTTNGKEFYQNGDLSLFHGPAFQAITRVLNISQKKLTAECLWQGITPQQQGQFPVHADNPYTNDLSSQTIWVWLKHFYQQVCLPGQINHSQHFAMTPCNEPFYVSCEILSKTDNGVTADLIIHSREGKIYSQILGAKAIIWPMKLPK